MCYKMHSFRVLAEKSTSGQTNPVFKNGPLNLTYETMKFFELLSPYCMS